MKGLAWLVAVAVLVSSLLPAPVCAAFVESVPEAAPTAAPVPTAVPALPALPTSAAVPNLTPAAWLSAPAPQAAQAAQAPQASASLAQLASPAKPGAAAASPAQAQSAVYDGAAKPAAQSEAPVAAGDWTGAAPELPLAALTPQWLSAGPSLGDRLAAVGSPAAKTELGDEDALSASDDLKRDDVNGAIVPGAKSDQLSYFDSSAFTAKTGIKQAALVGKTLLWLDEAGTFYGHDVERRKTMKFASPLGAVDRFAVGGDGYLYVSAGGHLQRWNLETGKAAVYLDERLSTAGGAQLTPTADGVEVVSGSARFSVSDRKVSQVSGGESFAASVFPAGPSLSWSANENGTRVWTSAPGGLADAGSLPLKAEAAAASRDGKTLYVAAEGSLYEWQLEAKRYRRVEVPGLADAGVGRAPALSVSPEGTVVLTAADKVFLVDSSKQSSDMGSKEAQTRLWSEQNPMYVRDGFLHIGEFRFPIEAPKAPADTRSGLRKLVDRVLGRPGPQAPERGPLVSERDWRALNLPTNKWALYQTLKSFSLGQHMLYIGETGGGKTWMASMVAKVTGNDLWMVSLTEYTRNQDLIARDTFGEEGKGKTGLSKSVVLKWLENGGVLLLDEMHKPLEGIASLNNILQNLEYRMPDGRVIKGDPKKCFVIGTMNPVKPPYRGEPPSGELESRFGAKMQINYLPPAEEAALLSIFHPSTSQKMAQALVKIANDLRKVYPDVLPLPISSRTLRHIVERMEKYPGDDPVEVFKIAFNPTALVDDPSIGHAIDKALQAHDLRGARAASQGDSRKN